MLNFVKCIFILHDINKFNLKLVYIWILDIIMSPIKPSQSPNFSIILIQMVNSMMWFVMQACRSAILVQHLNEYNILFTWLWLYLQHKYVCVYVIWESAFIWRLLFANVCWLR